jgi:S-layer protein (TIGR01567 family)
MVYLLHRKVDVYVYGMANDMNLIWIILLGSFLVSSMIVAAIDEVEIDKVETRGQIAEGSFEWNPQNFAGFYYDLNNDIGTETINFRIDNSNGISGDDPYGINYITTAQKKNFEFKDWGYYNVIGFLGKKYFAGYVKTGEANRDLFSTQEGDTNSIQEQQLIEILIDDDHEITWNITSDGPLKLMQNYEIKATIDANEGNKLFIELKKSGNIVDKKIIDPYSSKINSSTYYYKHDVGSQRDLVIIAVHFKNTFRGNDQNVATVDGTWQLNESPVQVTQGTIINKMEILPSTGDSISMANKDHPFNLSKKISRNIMGDLNVKTAKNDTLRYYILNENFLPGRYEVRSSVASGNVGWNSQNFAGFYYDLDDNIGTESFVTRITEGRKLSGKYPYGVVYTTQAQRKMFQFENWGYYNVIGFLGKKYFAGYLNDDKLALMDPNPQILYEYSETKDSFEVGQLEEILVDNNTEIIVKSGTSIKLKEGYVLTIKEIDMTGNKISLELSKNGLLVELKIITPSIYKSNISDETYWYKKTVGRQSNLVILAIHFKNAFRDDTGLNVATIDGFWQLSDSYAPVEDETFYEKMTVTKMDPDTLKITMCNKGKDISLPKNKTKKIIPAARPPWLVPPTDEDIPLMGDILIRTADSDSLRYYLYKQNYINSSVRIDSVPQGAEVYIDNVSSGISPLNLSIVGGYHQIELRQNAYLNTKIERVITDPNEKINVTLEKLDSPQIILTQENLTFAEDDMYTENGKHVSVSIHNPDYSHINEIKIKINPANGWKIAPIEGNSLDSLSSYINYDPIEKTFLIKNIGEYQDKWFTGELFRINPIPNVKNTDNYLIANISSKYVYCNSDSTIHENDTLERINLIVIKKNNLNLSWLDLKNSIIGVLVTAIGSYLFYYFIGRKNLS